MSLPRQFLQRTTRPSLTTTRCTAPAARWITDGPYGSKRGNSTTDPAAGASVKPSTKGTDSPKSHEQNQAEADTVRSSTSHISNSHTKSQAERDQETRSKLDARDSDGGAAGIEYEDGKPVSMKRSVKNNMFRYI